MASGLVGEPLALTVVVPVRYDVSANGQSGRGGSLVRVSSLAKLAATGVAVGGASYVPFASSIGAQPAGATSAGFHHVVTTDPQFYVEFKHAFCSPILPHGHIRLYNCFYFVP